MTRLPLTVAALCAALLVTPVATAAPPRAAATDWLVRATVTPLGSYVRGNPAAKVKLVEYLSFTCSHCAAFAAESGPPLEALIRSGRVSVEMRHAVRDRFDLAAALLARCQGPTGFFKAADAVFAAQQVWLGRAATLPEPVAAGSMNEVLVGVARGVGLDRVAAPGLAPDKVAACIGNAAEQARLARMRDEAWNERRIPGTPFFLINGRPVTDGNGWAGLEPVLRAALR